MYVLRYYMKHFLTEKRILRKTRVHENQLQERPGPDSDSTQNRAGPWSAEGKIHLCAKWTKYHLTCLSGTYHRAFIAMFQAGNTMRNAQKNDRMINRNSRRIKELLSAKIKGGKNHEDVF